MKSTFVQLVLITVAMARWLWPFELPYPARKKSLFRKGIISMDNRKKELLARIENDFKYHPPKNDQEQRYQENRNWFLELARHIIKTTPVSREQSLALTALEEAMFFANAAIARNE